MFSDSATRRRNVCIIKRNVSPISRNSPLQKACVRPFNPNLFVMQPAVAADEVFQVDDSEEVPMTQHSIACQTVFRESSAQTDSWLPDAKVRDGEACAPEAMIVEVLADPGIRHVEAIERARIQLDWEAKLPQVTDKDFPSRILQLEAFEWQRHLARERDLNEMQADRMEQVAALIEKRQESNSDFNQLMLENVKRRNDLHSDKQKSKLQKSLSRKVKVLFGEKFGKSSKFEQKFKKSGNPSFDFNSIRENLFNSVELAQSTKISKQTRDLSTPVAKLLRGRKPEKHLKVLYESVKQTGKQQKSETFECRKLLVAHSSEHDDLNFKSDDYCNHDAIEVQKTIKGIFVQNKLICSMDDSMQSIQDFRRQFQIESVTEVLPNEVTEVKAVPKKVEFKLEDFTEDIVAPFVTEILHHAENVGAMLQNQKLLQEAEIRRRLHIEKQLREQKLEDRRQEIKTAIDNVQKALAEKVLNNMLPVVVEMISEEDAMRFAADEARKIDDVACRSNGSVVEAVEETLQEFVVPEIERRVKNQSKSDDRTVALFGAYNSIEEYLRNPLNLTEKVDMDEDSLDEE